uniref:Bestrophin homolog n=1 Tax=Caenorhabditis tropicalis TaxID=1561998 RepID=A0A1I7UF02_9PELO
MENIAERRNGEPEVIEWAIDTYRYIADLINRELDNYEENRFKYLRSILFVLGYILELARRPFSQDEHQVLHGLYPTIIYLHGIWHYYF